MPDGTQFTTIAPGVAVSKIKSLSGDLLLIGLASEWRAADAAAEAAYVVLSNTRPHDERLWRRYVHHENRSSAFLRALLSAEAEGLSGALAQLEGIAGIDGLEGDDRERLSGLALASITSVVRQAASGAR